MLQTDSLARELITIRGRVQGVGFRPFIYRLAQEHGLVGTISNTCIGVKIDVQGIKESLDKFQREIVRQKPERAVIAELAAQPLLLSDFTSFEIAASESSADKALALLPDTGICAKCLQELFDPKNRRYQYPFLHCISCGPRFSLFLRMPFDRDHTTMREFCMCGECKSEYADPTDRRFYSQTNCCPTCGPQLQAVDTRGEGITGKEKPLEVAAEYLKQGKIVAMKNTGGYLLLVDATNEAAVQRLRERKQRPGKPFALLMPNLAAVEAIAHLADTEKQLLTSPPAPIVLLRKKEESCEVVPSVSQESPYHGIMLPHNALQYLLLGSFGRPLVATSGNISGSPLCITEEEAFETLPGVADLFLIHNRKIHHRLDDSIVHVIADQPVVMRKARGYTPDAVAVPESLYQPLVVNPHLDCAKAPGLNNRKLPHISNIGQLTIVQPRELWRSPNGDLQLEAGIKARATQSLFAAGSQMKNSFAFLKHDQIYMSQYIGDLDSAESCKAFDKEVASWEALLGLQNVEGVGDKHPDYYSSEYLAKRNKSSASIYQPLVVSPHLDCAKAPGLNDRKLPHISNMGQLTIVQPRELSRSPNGGFQLEAGIQHHKAHVWAAMADNGLSAPFLGVAWDGTGWGEDGTVWGGEAFSTTEEGLERIASLYPFPLPGGEKAVREPRRSLLGLFHALFGEELPPGYEACLDQLFTKEERAVLGVALQKKINTPLCSSVGRLFDAVSALLGLCKVSNFEGQAALLLEAAAHKGVYQPLVVNSHFDCAKAPGLNDRKLPHISNIGQLTIVQPRELSRSRNGDFQLEAGITRASFPGIVTRPSSSGNGLILLDWRPLIRQIFEEKIRGVPVADMALAFHEALALSIVELAKRGGHEKILLTGGVMQNKLLVERAMAYLKAAGFKPYIHRNIPPNDGGIAVGQLIGKLSMV